MRPIDFPESNKVLTKPEGMTDEECSSLHIFSDGTNCISLWKADTLMERLRFLFTGKMWVWLISGHSQPPVLIVTDLKFNEEQTEEAEA